ncbi:hypothetical protein TYRP_001798, partial [Tyrophagus putrescentiae]
NRKRKTKNNRNKRITTTTTTTAKTDTGTVDTNAVDINIVETISTTTTSAKSTVNTTATTTTTTTTEPCITPTTDNNNNNNKHEKQSNTKDQEDIANAAVESVNKNEVVDGSNLENAASTEHIASFAPISPIAHVAHIGNIVNGSIARVEYVDNNFGAANTAIINLSNGALVNGGELVYHHQHLQPQEQFAVPVLLEQPALNGLSDVSNGFRHCECENCCAYRTPSPLENSLDSGEDNARLVLDETLAAMGCSPGMFVNDQSDCDRVMGDVLRELSCQECGPFCVSANFMTPIYAHCSATNCNGHQHCAEERSNEMFDSHSFDRGSNDNEHEESDNEQTESATSSELSFSENYEDTVNNPDENSPRQLCHFHKANSIDAPFEESCSYSNDHNYHQNYYGWLHPTTTTTTTNNSYNNRNSNSAGGTTTTTWPQSVLFLTSFSNRQAQEVQG